MKRRTPTIGRGYRALVAVLGLGLFGAVLHFGCGRMPPEAFWEPTAEDTAAIDAVVQANKQFFLSSFYEAALDSINTNLPGTTATRLENEMHDNPYKQRFRCDMFQHEFFTDSFDLEYTIAALLDTARAETTCTVTMAETIPGLFHMHAHQYTRFIKVDTFFPSPSETLLLSRYDTLFSDTSMTVTKPLAGASTSGCVLKKENDEWRLWKVGGGSRFYAPNPDDSPYILYLNLASRDTTLQFQLRPDTTQYGIQRFYDLEDEGPDPVITSVPTFRVNDTLSVTSFATTNLDAANYVHFNGIRHEFSASDKVPLDTPGLYYLYLEQIPIEVLYEMDGEFVALVWGLVIRVVE